MVKKKRRPISRRFWSLLKYMPEFLRAPFLRSQFKVPRDLASEIILKQAESEHEVTQALRMVYDSYLDLNYIDSNQARLRVTKHHLLPTTITLVAVVSGEVLGTLSIIVDSNLKLPSDLTWDLSRFRKNGQQIAEISSLTISKKTERRAQLLLPMCKLMYLYCKNLLKLDGIIVSTTLEVENFYTDLLLFEKVVHKTGQANQIVKGNPSTCCYLPLSDTLSEDNYRKIYAHKSDDFNLYKFFVKSTTANIKLPTVHQCLQSYTVKQTMSYSKILENYPELLKNLDENDQNAINNLDPSKVLKIPTNFKHQQRGHRYEIRQKAKVYFSCSNLIKECTLLNVSASGFKLILNQETQISKNQKTVLIFFSIGDQTFEFEGQIQWMHDHKLIGCTVSAASTTNNEWHKFFADIENEFQQKAG